MQPWQRVSATAVNSPPVDHQLPSLNRQHRGIRRRIRDESNNRGSVPFHKDCPVDEPNQPEAKEGAHSQPHRVQNRNTCHSNGEGSRTQALVPARSRTSLQRSSRLSVGPSHLLLQWRAQEDNTTSISFPGFRDTFCAPAVAMHSRPPGTHRGSAASVAMHSLRTDCGYALVVAVQPLGPTGTD
jgi:hypothetical protein